MDYLLEWYTISVPYKTLNQWLHLSSYNYLPNQLLTQSLCLKQTPHNTNQNFLLHVWLADYPKQLLFDEIIDWIVLHFFYISDPESNDLHKKDSEWLHNQH